MDMLSARKVRIHGMQSSRWSVRDKLTQYKGLTNLYARDKKILATDAAIACKKQVREIKQLRKDIRDGRFDLGNAIQGDHQLLRNSLAEHKDLQLGFQNLPPIRVIDHLNQDNFSKRKFLDRLDYKMKQKTQMLINLKLELAELEDRMKEYENNEQIPVEKEAQIITGKVQDAILKKEAALSVGRTYCNILTILKKDSIYFDAVLASLRMDGYSQSKCMIRTTELGQLATEYLDDRKHEFKELERAVKRDMKAREASLQIVRQEVNDLNNSMGMLIRRDSDINMGKVTEPRSNEDVELQQSLESMENILKTLQDMTFVSHFDDIFPCLKEQQKQTNRLKELLDKSMKDRDSLINKKKHAEEMYITLMYTMNETTLEYIKEKKRLQKEIKNIQEKKESLQELIIHQGTVLMKLRSALLQLSQKCSIIKSKGDSKPAKIEAKLTICVGDEKTATNVMPPLELEEDGLKIIASLEPKLNILMNNATSVIFDDEKSEFAYKLFHQLISSTCPIVHYDECIEVEDSLISDVSIEDSQVPTYFDIKAKSKYLVEISTIDEDLMFMTMPKKKLGRR